MQKWTRNHFWLGSLAIAALTLTAGDALAQQKANDRQNQQKQNAEQAEDQAGRTSSHTGEFVAPGEGTFTMSRGGEATHEHKVTEQTEVTIDGRKAELKDLRKGDRIKVTSGEGNVALKIEALRRQTAGDQPRQPQLPREPRQQPQQPERSRQQAEQTPRQPQPGQPQQTQQRRQQGVSLGVRLEPSPTTGVLIRDLQPQGPAAQAGLRTGDYILAIDGKTIDSVQTFDQTMTSIQPGDRTNLTIWRDRQRQQLTVAFPQRGQAAYRPDRENGAAGRGWLGVLLQEAEEGQTGVRIGRIYPSGPAARAGLRSGDLLVAIDDKQVSSADEAVRLISNFRPDQEIQLTVLRGEQQQNITAILADRSTFVGDEQFPPQGGQRGAGFDDGFTVPDHAMMLEQHRRFAEQHQRIEQKLDEVMQELQALRRQIGGPQSQRQPQEGPRPQGQGPQGPQPQGRPQ